MQQEEYITKYKMKEYGDKKITYETDLFECDQINNFTNLIKTANTKNIKSEHITNLKGWDVIKLDTLKNLNINENIKVNIHFEMLHYGKGDNTRPIFILPGFSVRSLTMIIGRIHLHKDKILEKFSDIYIFNNTSIGKLPNLLSDKHNIPFPTTYQKISNGMKIFFDNYNNISLLGRFAGGGISMFLTFKYLESNKIIGLNLACSGYDITSMKTIIPNFNNKKLLIRLCWAKQDQKILIDSDSGGTHLNQMFQNSGYTNFKYYVIENVPSNIEGKDKYIHTHQIQKKLIYKLV